ncbi:MAG: hypothetical protein WDM86_18300 [Rhizomicrobium sp.]
MLAPALGEAEGDHAEHVMVFAWRMLVAGRARCPVLRDELAAAAGAQAMDVLSALSVFLTTLGNGSRHRLCVGPPRCSHRTTDEQAMLALIAAAQDGDEERVAAHLRWLVVPDQRDAVSRSVQALAELADRASLHIPAPVRQHIQGGRRLEVLDRS